MKSTTLSDSHLPRQAEEEERGMISMKSRALSTLMFCVRRMLIIYVLLLSGSSFVGCMAETEVLVVPLMDLLAGVRSPPSSAMEGRSDPIGGFNLRSILYNYFN